MSESEVKEVQVETPSAVVAFNREGMVDFKDQMELGTLARLVRAINLVPDHLKTTEAVMSALTFCKQYNLPYAAMNELAYIKGKLGAFGTLYTALAQRHPDFGEMVVLYTDKDMKVINLENKNLNAEVWACVIRIKKKSDSEFHEYFFTKDEAVKAGAYKDVYLKYLKDMLYHRAKKRAFDTEYASAVKGVMMAELLIEDDRVREVTPLEEMNQRFVTKRDDDDAK